MREALFRGKRVSDGEWVKESKFYSRDAWGTRLLDHKNDVVDVIPETVGQSMGTIDKNGRRIYDGDILAGHRDGNAVVAWDEENARVIGCHADMTFMFAADEFRDYEVIGNIHDNPGLLKQKGGPQ